VLRNRYHKMREQIAEWWVVQDSKSRVRPYGG